jgi:hypothetical protein
MLALAGIFGAALLKMRLRAALPDHHCSTETKDSVRVGMVLVATMTALLPGAYDAQRSNVMQIPAKVGFLDRVLQSTARKQPVLRQYWIRRCFANFQLNFEIH